MKKVKILCFTVIGLLFIALFLIKIQTKPYLSEKNNTLNILKMETKEVTYEEMHSIVMTKPTKFDVIKKEERIENETFDCIVLKTMEFEWNDITVEVGAYFDVDKESKLVNDTLFAWSMPSIKDSKYSQAHITEMVIEYPTEEVNIRARGIYDATAIDMNLFYKVE